MQYKDFVQATASVHLKKSKTLRDFSACLTLQVYTKSVYCININLKTE